jgi:hypothetical protein
VRAIAVVPVVGQRDPEREQLAAMRDRLVQFDQTRSVLDVERVEEQRAYEADDGGRGANAQRQRHHHQESEPARPRQQARAMLHVPPQPYEVAPLADRRRPIEKPPLALLD